MRRLRRLLPLALLASLPFFAFLPEGGAAPKGPSISSAMWQSIAPMSTPRRWHEAHFAPGVGLVVVGGYAQNGIEDTAYMTAERLDLATGTWSALTPPPAGIENASSGVLPDGRIFFLDAGHGATYDPATDTWTNEPALALNYEYNGVLGVLADGSVIAAGSQDGEDVTNQSVRYDPVTQTVVSSPKLKQYRSAHTGTMLPDGRFLVTGGWTWGMEENHVTLTVAETFDSMTNTWTLVAPMGTGRKGHAAALMSSGKVLVSGGVEENTGIISSAEIYDPATDTWTPVASMSVQRWYHVMTELPSGRVMVTGGRISGGETASVEVYDPALDTWISLPDMASPRSFHTATYVPGHGVVIAGGTPGNGSLASVEIYPLGNAAAGESCVIGDECVSGVCESGQCTDPGSGSGGAGGMGGEGGAGGEGGMGGAGGEGGMGGAGGEGGMGGAGGNGGMGGAGGAGGAGGGMGGAGGAGGSGGQAGGGGGTPDDGGCSVRGAGAGESGSAGLFAALALGLLAKRRRR
ncbi:Kelch repeat-containing protein [Polyangium spumosum]|uniref:Kelch-like protein n=1 Tax=Polyangium spumosum TaxID=889282 RepID=A0A6N7PMT3_9BACT|nr:kelch repeat-containing protein [Polyangium spumosum]MRG93393.1 hypothetical protein [Polyangium spumosum]